MWSAGSCRAAWQGSCDAAIQLDGMVNALFVMFVLAADQQQ
jgi:hypothetical protein